MSTSLTWAQRQRVHVVTAEAATTNEPSRPAPGLSMDCGVDGDVCEEFFSSMESPKATAKKKESKRNDTDDGVSCKSCWQKQGSCVRCGCSREWDSFGERVCWCDACRLGGCEPEDLGTCQFRCCASCAAREDGDSNVEVSLKFEDPGAERMSAELEQRAATEAEALISADGCICFQRLALLCCASNEAFVHRVLSRAPFTALDTLPYAEWDLDAWNTALLLEDFKEIRQWKDAPATTRSAFPMRLVSVFDSKLSLDEYLEHYGNLVSLHSEFAREHPTLRARPIRTIEGTMVNLEEFRSLLRSFSGGILEGVPLDSDKLILGGSAMPWCMRRLTPRERALCAEERRATKFEAGLLAHLRAKLGLRCAESIMWMALDLEPHSSIGLRGSLVKEFHTAAWEDADIDLFVVGDDAEATISRTVDILQRNISKATGGRPSVVLKTKNTLTVVGGYPFPNVQVVCKVVRSCQELLVHSDVDCSAMAYDGARVWAAVRALRALAIGYNFIPKVVLTRYGPKMDRSIARFNKYFNRGFSLLVFEHCRHLPRCDHSVPPGALERVQKLKGEREPRNIKGTPAQKAQALAKWMFARCPKLRRQSQEDSTVQRRSADKVDVREHRWIPGDKTEGRGSASRCDGSGRPTSGRGKPFRNYSQFMDLLIPCGPNVCAETLREYVRLLGRPDLLAEVSGADPEIAPKQSSDRQSWQERQRGKCYMCRAAVKTQQPWPMCEECSEFNRRKREERADCKGMVAVVTGGRVKIGHECALRLLRNGATVVVTSRFPRGALEKFSLEEDFAQFRERLLILEADFRRLQSVQRVIDVVLEKFDRMDILIHNAAQTVRRPPAYYESLLKRERELANLADWTPGGVQSSAVGNGSGLFEDALAVLPVPMELFPPVLASDKEAEVKKAAWFPEGKVDAHGDQLDLRPATSWTMHMEEVEMPELVEVMAVNLIVPYLLTARWLPLLRQSSGAFVIFVTSQEGSFSTPNGSKNCQHPHTNAAKAGLNMLAKTVAGELRRDSIFTSAVDPGWVSWMKPGGSQALEEAPLSEADGAARVLDPIFSGLRALAHSRCPPTGVLFKDFRVAPW